ncbi:MAG: hypothetical protein JRI95_06205 [Deltaproteobacteria bacterium]|nr:hypothetical protein [Deltaproteobacteria bacterium]
MKQRLFGLTLAALIIASVLGCEANRPGPAQLRPTHDTAVRNEKARGLNLELIAFSWYYQKDMDRVHVSGRVRNLTGQNIQACRLIVMAYDQFNRYLGRKEAFLQPTYIPADRKARFDFYLEDGRDVKSLHLNYHFMTRY